jgi:hypothetical protein
VVPSSSLTAKKRRRRKDKAFDENSTTTTTDNNDDLPDFDIDEDEGDTASPTSKKSKETTTANRVMTKTEFGEEITASMMNTRGTSAPTKSVRDLINDRSLEQKLEFYDDNDGQDLPDLIQMAQERRGDGATGTDDNVPISKKKARQAARQAAAAARQQEEENSLEGLLQQIPFLLNEKGKVSGVKILEAGTWAGIGLLVAWELYINSPFFERAAPVIPVVY